MATFWRAFHRDGKFSPAWQGGGHTPSHFSSIYHHEKNKVVVYASADTLLLFLLYPFLLCGGDRLNLTGRSKTTVNIEYNPKICASQKLAFTIFSGPLLPVPKHITIHMWWWGEVFGGSWRSVLWQCRFKLPTQIPVHSKKTVLLPIADFFHADVHVLFLHPIVSLVTSLKLTSLPLPPLLPVLTSTLLYLFLLTILTSLTSPCSSFSIF